MNNDGLDNLFDDDDSGTEQICFENNYDFDSQPSAPNAVNEKPNGAETLTAPKDLPQEQVSEETSNNTLTSPPKQKETHIMSNFDNAIAKAVSEIPECVAAGYVDLNSGMLLGIKTVDSHPSDVMDFLAAATHDLFQGQNVVTIEGIFKQARGLEQDDFHYFKEIIVNSENLIHVFLRSKQDSQHVACFVCRLSANLGMVLTKARGQMPMLEAAL